MRAGIESVAPGRRLAAIAAAVVAMLFAATATAQVPVSFTQQGRLLDKSGDPVTGSKEVTFTVYDSETGGEALWEVTKLVKFDDQGFYTTSVGSKGNPITPSVMVGGDRWLGIAIEDSKELEPRVKLRSVPYSHVSGQAEAVADGSVDRAALSDNLRTKVQSPSPKWEDVQDKPDGAGETIGGLSCQSGHVPVYDGSAWTCQKAYSDLDAVKAVKTADDYVQKIGDQMSGELDMQGNRITNVGSPTDKVDAATKEYVDQQIAQATAPEKTFWWAAVSLENSSTKSPTYTDQSGNTETLSVPGAGGTSCSSGNSVCIYNNSGNHFEISILIPSSVDGGRNAPDFGNLMCWATAPGDNEAFGSRDNLVDAYAVDINGGHDHCLPGSVSGGNQCIGIQTTGTSTDSHTTYGVVCVK